MGIFSASMRSVLAVSATAAALLFIGCTAAQPASNGPGDSTQSEAPPGIGSGAAATIAAITELGLDIEDPVSLAEGLDALPVADRPEGLAASILPTKVLLQPDQPSELAIPIPEGDFYLSLAPYRTQTHPCTFHVPTSCLGELRKVDVQLRVTEVSSGEVIVDKQARTADNGFVGVWLPRDGEFVVEATVDGDTGSQTVRTGDEDPTCLTTLQLAG